MSRTPRLCGKPGSTKCLKTATRKGRCEDHQIAPFDGAKDRWKAARPKNWSIIRRYVITRAGRRCELCSATGTEVDHIKPVAEGGTWGLENLQCLCVSCHAVKTAEDAQRGRQRRRR